MITSAQNKTIKEVKALSRKKERVKTGLFIAEGLRFVQSAVESQAHIECILYSSAILRTDEGRDFIKDLEDSGQYKVLEVEDKIMEELSDTMSPQGILAVVRQPSWTWDDVLGGSRVVMILDRLQDPGNLGTILRTADAAGASGMILLKGTVDLFNPKVLRSTMGSVFSLPVLEGVLWEEAEDKLKGSDYLVAATALEDSVDYDSLDYRGPTAFIVGNEANGIEDHILNRAPYKVKIPIVGSAESLNAGVAAAIMMYEALRQRK